MNPLIQMAVLTGFVLSAGQFEPLHANDTTDLHRFEFERIEMGVQFRIAVYGSDSDAANNAATAAFDRIHQLNSIFSDYESSSEVRQLCENAVPGCPVRVSCELFEVLAASMRLSEETDGAFDVTVGHLSKLWRRARRREVMPDSDRLKEALNLTSFRLIRLYPTSRCVELLRPGMRIDLGGIAKGYAADEALRTLSRHGFTRAMVDAGGDIVAGDPPPGSKHWQISVQPLNPQNDADFTTLLIRNQAVATSGDAYQSVLIEGRRYSHILNPKTGLGLERRSSVTVIAPSGMTADSLASALSVLDPTASIAFVEHPCRPQTEAYIVYTEGDSETGQQLATGGLSRFVSMPSGEALGNGT